MHRLARVRVCLHTRSLEAFPRGNEPRWVTAIDCGIGMHMTYLWRQCLLERNSFSVLHGIGAGPVTGRCTLHLGNGASGRGRRHLGSLQDGLVGLRIGADDRGHGHLRDGLVGLQARADRLGRERVGLRVGADELGQGLRDVALGLKLWKIFMLLWNMFLICLAR